MASTALFIADLPDTLTAPAHPTAGPSTPAPARAGGPTTLAIGEEGGDDDGPTTLAVGEEGDDDD